ncbi:hypothetical protein C7M61_000657 [Candidozyma pseudohaemuli]|uniref:Zn(2)-C6 fungal-type domain-containing protein n=1 Tax=Candidozyma pseudohaemuli TaxID=418784 RepID=A0A2P7YYG0_9ASCO|nr:hypothetical protein C7M61_000657 [[Candida] pseudohaemulonii]PSK40990.1 hypothetical protein C7M61_000657 [[Candida] pseudohaemulonii]
MPPDALEPPKGSDAKKSKSKGKVQLDPLKTITAPGSSVTRIAQACDRCRAKKSKCDGKRPACSACAAVGIKCVVSDKLSRRAFPKGYTETLEERIRQLEAENTKLQGLLDLRDEQRGISSSIGDVSNSRSDSDLDSSRHNESSNIPNFLNPHSVLHTHTHGDGCACCSGSNVLHERPVSLAGSVYGESGNVSVPQSVLSGDDDDTHSLLSLEDPLFLSQSRPFDTRFNSFPNKEVSPAPGAFAAATAIEQMQKMATPRDQQLEEESKQKLLTHLLAASIPRSTEETLFIPTLLAKICQVYGYGSKPAIITANALASLKETLDSQSLYQPDYNEEADLMSLIMDRTDVTNLSHYEAMRFLKMLHLPNRAELDHLLTLYFKEWGNIMPLVNKGVFLKNFLKLDNLVDHNSDEPSYEYSYELTEKVGALMVLVVSFGILSQKFELMHSNDKVELRHRAALLNRYDKLIHEFIKPNCLITKYCSLQSLQILALALQYCLAIGDVTTCYELRGRVISMAQQLRLHRCPAAVLGLNGKDINNVNLQNFMQGERRILFWCIYCLDAYSSLNLGIPRLLKDYEIECAMPFSGSSEDERDNENVLIVNNTKLTIFGRVSKLALSLMQYCKVLGNIMDSIFTRSGDVNVSERALEKDRILECWRRDLPQDLKFEIDVNGFSLRDHTNIKLAGGMEGTNWSIYSRHQLVMIFLYYHAKVLIYLPIISKYGYHHNVGLSMKERVDLKQRDVASVISSMTMIQQSSIQILEVMKIMASNSAYSIPIPINLPREKARFALLVAKGSLDFIKGGPLHQSLKSLLILTLSEFNQETEMQIPGGLTPNSTRLLELSIMSILGISPLKNSNNLRKRVMLDRPISKQAVMRDALYVNGMEDQAYSKPRQASTFVKSESMDLPSLDIPTQSPTIDMSNSNNDSNGSSNEESLEELLHFDPFTMNYSNQLMATDFAADGSLGLVPFLNENPDEYRDDDQMSDRIDEDGGAVSFGW